MYSKVFVRLRLNFAPKNLNFACKSFSIRFIHDLGILIKLISVTIVFKFLFCLKIISWAPIQIFKDSTIVGLVFGLGWSWGCRNQSVSLATSSQVEAKLKASTLKVSQTHNFCLFHQFCLFTSVFDFESGFILLFFFFFNFIFHCPVWGTD